MAPISLPISNDSPHDAVLRFKWDSPQLNPKAVGGHLTLGKRNSTPVDFGVPPPPFVRKPCAPAGGGNGMPCVMPPHSETPVPPAASHRRLDRSQSDPLRQQQGSPTDGASAGSAAPSSSRYKTELCRPFAETGFCKYGDKCQFAHGEPELRNMPRHPKYKTERCRTFHSVGFCTYGARCHFIHNYEERRDPGGSSPPASSSSSPTAIQSPHSPLGAPSQFLKPHEELSPSGGPPVLTPPHSLNGSPTPPTGTFFGGSFGSVFAHSEPLEAVGAAPHLELFGDAFSFPYTPPGSPHQSEPFSSSPVESLVGDVDNLVLDPAGHGAPDAGTVAPMGLSCPEQLHQLPPRIGCASPTLDASLAYLRLPIFETLTE